MKLKIILYLTLIIIAFLSTIYFSVGYLIIIKNENSSTNIDLSNDKNYIDKFNSDIKTEESKENIFSIKLSFAGDTMLASLKDKTSSDNFNDYANKKEPSYFLEKVSSIFENDDFTVLNLENVLTDRKLSEISKSTEPAFWFKSKTSNVNILTSSSVEGVSVANNHTKDYGKLGKQDTIDTLINANVQYGDYDHIMYFQKNNYVVAVICNGLWTESHTTRIIKLIKEAEEKSDYQIIFFHGGKEKLHKPEKWKIKAARKLVDNGADLVIGAHPHVLQPREIYNDKEIIYSLGNFCYGGHKKPENRTIIYQMNLTVDNNTNLLLKEESNIIPCYVYTTDKNNYQPAPIEDENIKNKVIDFMNWKVDSPL